MFYFLFFFFQAEDGIRDADVTGVQTCALPILLLPPSWIGEFRVGAVVYGSDQNGEAGARNVKVGPWLSFSTNIVYGVPGTPGLTLRQPFDHFEASGWITFMSNAQP